MGVFCAKRGKEIGDLLPQLVDLVLVAQLGADAEEILTNRWLSTIPWPILRLILRGSARVGQVGLELLGNATPLLLRLSQPVFTYVLAFEDGAGRPHRLAEIDRAVLSAAGKQMQVWVGWKEQLEHERRKRITKVFVP
jgi:hypothetical protein